MREPYEILKKIKEKKPLVHHITNWVTIYDCANIVRAFGALPVMAHAVEEASEMTKIASTLVLNIGTLTPELVDTMIVAGRQANKKKIPVILDAVGAGATRLRTESTLKILRKIKVDVLKGNAGEIATIAGAEAEVKGVESMGVKGSIQEIACNLARKEKNVVVVTGKEDVITDGKRTYIVKNGHAMMGSIVGTGCMAASVIGAFCGVEKDYAKAAAAALSCFGIAGELAAKKAKGPGTFKEQFYDETYNLDEKKINKMMKIKFEISSERR
ncbi:MAG: hydroxyethylthiazole kinase [Candidatus Altiarchaeales archaeon]|nr:hydroxyethylthiazole kinase [Candidatus Altiarchaeales archaeon]